MTYVNALDYKGAGIYKFTNRINGKLYIGQAQNIHKRYANHSELKSNTLFGRALKKYGLVGFSFQVIELVKDVKLLNEREQYWMDFFQAYDNTKGYNICKEAGSSRGMRHSLETKQKLSSIRKLMGPPSNETRAKLSFHTSKRIGEKHPMFGKKQSEEAKNKMSIARIGKVQTQEHRNAISRAQTTKKRIAQYDLKTGDYLAFWDCVNDAFNQLGINRTCISAVINGRRKSAGGFGWRTI